MYIGLLGMGTIGSGVFEIAQKLEGIQVKKVLERRFQAEYITDRIDEIVNDPEIELVVETMGGLHPAYEFAVEVLSHGKHFVTANKLLVSTYWAELTTLAREKGVSFLYGAACGGGIAYLANLEIAREIDRLNGLGGILNGTTNYILDSMQSKGMDYAGALSQAQSLGYAERDPSSDVDGLDTLRKLVLACAVGFDAYLSPDEIPAFGISRVQPVDIEWARSQNLVLRLCAQAQRDKKDKISAYVEPTLVGAQSPEAAILQNVNYAWYSGEEYGLMSYTGQGAGKLPTAANVLRDVRSAAAGHRSMTSERCRPAHPENDIACHRYYLRNRADRPIPEGWSEQAKVIDGWMLCRTRPLSVTEVHSWAAGQPDTFIAGIREE